MIITYSLGTSWQLYDISSLYWDMLILTGDDVDDVKDSKYEISIGWQIWDEELR